jgi:hypothetical protein
MGTKTNKHSRNDLKLAASKPQPKTVSHREPDITRNSQGGSRAIVKPGKWR